MSTLCLLISVSTELPIFTGTIEVDTSNGPITIFMKSPPYHENPDNYLIIKKISTDNNIISLFSESCFVNNCDIIIFGLPPHAKVIHGKVSTLVLIPIGSNWKIIREQ